jgi:hypothetical protein
MLAIGSASTALGTSESEQVAHEARTDHAEPLAGLDPIVPAGRGRPVVRRCRLSQAGNTPRGVSMLATSAQHWLFGTRRGWVIDHAGQWGAKRRGRRSAEHAALAVASYYASHES